MESSKKYGITGHGSSSHNPDLDWSQIQETITMLALAVAQVESSMTDGEQSVSTLTRSFTHMADYVQKIRKVTKKVTPEKLDQFRDIIEDTTENLEHQVQDAVVAFQFYDRITQRLDHVCTSLDRLGTLISEPDLLFNPESWKSLQSDIKSSYTMEAERIMFEHILMGSSIQEALEIYRHHFDKEESDTTDGGDEIELF